MTKELAMKLLVALLVAVGLLWGAIMVLVTFVPGGLSR